MLVPGLVAAGIGSLIFVGLDNWTGLGTFSLALPDLPSFTQPTLGRFLWALVIGLLAAVIGTGIRRLALLPRPHVERRLVLVTPLVSLAVGALAIVYAEVTGHGFTDVLFSARMRWARSSARAPATRRGRWWCWWSARPGLRRVDERLPGGPIFPAMFLGAAGGIALSHLPGLPLVAGVAMGLGAMSVVMLGLPLTSVLLPTLLLASDALAVVPLVIVAVAVAYVASARLTPAPAGRPSSAPPAAAPASETR